jgi:hypothetical protein
MAPCSRPTSRFFYHRPRKKDGTKDLLIWRYVVTLAGTGNSRVSQWRSAVFVSTTSSIQQLSSRPLASTVNGVRKDLHSKRDASSWRLSVQGARERPTGVPGLAWRSTGCRPRGTPLSTCTHCPLCQPDVGHPPCTFNPIADANAPANRHRERDWP